MDDAPLGRPYRRSPSLVTYWRAGAHIIRSWSSEHPHAANPDILELLDELTEWTSAREMSSRDPELGDPASIAALFEEMHRYGWLEADRSSGWEESPWAAWHPEAAFFHFATKNGVYPDDPLANEARYRERAATDPPPPPTLSRAGTRVALPAPGDLGDLGATLERRRTWREFSTEPIGAVALSTLLQSTWGVRRWGRVAGQGRVALKTSPSAGARHPIEAYVLALNVRDIARGVYHYDAAAHALTDLSRPIEASTVPACLAHQDYFDGAAAIVIMTAVIARSVWRYPFSRAYRTPLIDAGHLGQTFCLVATALNLAPFCTMAFGERETEALLGLDPLREAPMYVVGAGVPPRDRPAPRGVVPPKRDAD